jgi:hypothetical protein
MPITILCQAAPDFLQKKSSSAPFHTRTCKKLPTNIFHLPVSHFPGSLSSIAKQETMG